MSGGNQIENSVLNRVTNESCCYKYLRISSKERNDGGTPYSFKVSFGNDIRLEKVYKVNVVSMQCPNVFYNVVVGKSTFSIIINSVTYNTTLTPGRYTVAAAMGKITTALNLLTGATQLTYSLTDGFVTLTSSILTDVIRVVGNDLGIQLGFEGVITSTGVYVATTYPNFLGVTMLYLHSSMLFPNITYLNDNQGNVNDVNGFVSMPINEPFGVLNNYLGQSNDEIVIDPVQGRVAKTFDITMRGNGGRLLIEFPQNAELILILKIFYK